MLLLLSSLLIVTGGSLLAGAQTCPDLFVEIEGSCYSFRSDYLATWDVSGIQRGTPFWAIDSGVLGWSQSPDGKTDENCLALTEEKLYYFDDSPCETYNHPVCQMI
ncbi:hypothetical protein Pmani_035426 [Petrolisthes manimaculis]|uniref:C-type lectin domain-containing protein n=1 Tax=Petrolisthes manimaculis TaxID=1843537 RepID=A0AAE1TNQ8_9EUCA|nr:hypothetical protein Pmani_035426 [Petrolisthes manimaculis]